MISEFLPWDSGYFWLSLAAVLFILEILTPTAIALGFAIGAILVAVGLFLGSEILENQILIVLVWASFSLFSWALVKYIFHNRAASRKPEKGDVNED